VRYTQTIERRRALAVSQSISRATLASTSKCVVTRHDNKHKTLNPIHPPNKPPFTSPLVYTAMVLHDEEISVFKRPEYFEARGAPRTTAATLVVPPSRVRCRRPSAKRRPRRNARGHTCRRHWAVVCVAVQRRTRRCRHESKKPRSSQIHASTT